MPNRVDIDRKHSGAIAREIGEKLRTMMEPEPELPANGLRELEERSPSISPAVGRWDKLRR
jgi:hypothetical protein